MPTSGPESGAGAFRVFSDCEDLEEEESDCFAACEKDKPDKAIRKRRRGNARQFRAHPTLIPQSYVNEMAFGPHHLALLARGLGTLTALVVNEGEVDLDRGLNLPRLLLH